MSDFQPVLNDPNYLYHNKVIAKYTYIRHIVRFRCYEQRPQVVTNMLDQYPT